MNGKIEAGQVILTSSDFAADYRGCLGCGRAEDEKDDNAGGIAVREVCWLCELFGVGLGPAEAIESDIWRGLGANANPNDESSDRDWLAGGKP